MASHEDRIPEEAARAIWRRAAQLQAEVERRQEEHARQIPAAAGRDGLDGDGLQVAEVRSAAEEAGIAPEFVQIALAEAAASGRPAMAVARRDILGSRLFLGASRRTIELTATTQGSVGEVSAACLQVFSGHPCQLQAGEIAELTSTSGRVVVFNVPKFDWSATANPPFVEKAAVVGLKQLHVAIRPLAGHPSNCEIVVAGDLYPGMRTGWRWSAGASLGAGAIGGAVAVGVASSVVAGALLALPALLGVGVIGGASVAAWAATYRYYRGKLEATLKETLERCRIDRIPGHHQWEQGPPPLNH